LRAVWPSFLIQLSELITPILDFPFFALRYICSAKLSQLRAGASSTSGEMLRPGNLQPSPPGPRPTRSHTSIQSSPALRGVYDDAVSPARLTPAPGAADETCEKRPKRRLAPMDPCSPAPRGGGIWDDDDTVVTTATQIPKSPFERPTAPKQCFYKSPPPMVISDRVERSEKRQRQLLNVQAFESKSYRDLGSLTPVEHEDEPDEKEEEEVLGGDQSFSASSNAVEGGRGRFSPVASIFSLNSIPSLNSLSRSSCSRRVGDTDTPPSGAHAFEEHETLVRLDGSDSRHAAYRCRRLPPLPLADLAAAHRRVPSCALAACCRSSAQRRDACAATSPSRRPSRRGR
jgi:hypothetical protein